MESILHQPTTAKLANTPHPAKAPPVAAAAVVPPSSSSLVRMTTPSSVSCKAALPPAAAAAAEGAAAGSAGAAGAAACCSACAAGSAPLSSKPSGCASSSHSSCSGVCAARAAVGEVFLRRAASRSSRLLGQHLVAGRASYMQTMRLQVPTSRTLWLMTSCALNCCSWSDTSTIEPCTRPPPGSAARVRGSSERLNATCKWWVGGGAHGKGALPSA